MAFKAMRPSQMRAGLVTKKWPSIMNEMMSTSIRRFIKLNIDDYKYLFGTLLQDWKILQGYISFL